MRNAPAAGDYSRDRFWVYSFRAATAPPDHAHHTVRRHDAGHARKSANGFEPEWRSPAASRFRRRLPGHDLRLELSHAEDDPIFAWQGYLASANGGPRKRGLDPARGTRRDG